MVSEEAGVVKDLVGVFVGVIEIKSCVTVIIAVFGGVVTVVV